MAPKEAGVQGYNHSPFALDGQQAQRADNTKLLAILEWKHPLMNINKPKIFAAFATLAPPPPTFPNLLMPLYVYIHVYVFMNLSSQALM